MLVRRRKLSHCSSPQRICPGVAAAEYERPWMYLPLHSHEDMMKKSLGRKPDQPFHVTVHQKSKIEVHGIHFCDLYSIRVIPKPFKFQKNNQNTPFYNIFTTFWTSAKFAVKKMSKSWISWYQVIFGTKIIICCSVCCYRELLHVLWQNNEQLDQCF